MRSLAIVVTMPLAPTSTTLTCQTICSLSIWPELWRVNVHRLHEIACLTIVMQTAGHRAPLSLRYDKARRTLLGPRTTTRSYGDPTAVKRYASRQ
ncbi:uncharacterized protein HD556DRAFT_45823 [Suillus plorans]|uniref:Uncharacterized protein n=1 Tax=Suillus plorans TaxID=116603 RepID=A0A9P7E489_9AGAM|nr:uncharacterized protein HD556DRAFT_45823 [Suillus plorans]KAG1810357.1 hypothetical protein HD556DRAFT_45823 [Suillus plorans]